MSKYVTTYAINSINLTKNKLLIHLKNQCLPSPNHP